MCVVDLGPPLHQSVVGGEPGAGGGEGGRGDAHWTGAATVEAVQVHLRGGGRQSTLNLEGRRICDRQCKLHIYLTGLPCLYDIKIISNSIKN